MGGVIRHTPEIILVGYTSSDLRDFALTVHISRSLSLIACEVMMILSWAAMLSVERLAHQSPCANFGFELIDSLRKDG